MINEWHKIWNNRNERFNLIDSDNEREVFMEMIRIDGGDITNDVTYDSYRDNYNGVKNAISTGGRRFLRSVAVAVHAYIGFGKTDIVLAG